MAEWDNQGQPLPDNEKVGSGATSHQTHNEPYDGEEFEDNVWMRGLYMVILAFLFGLAEMLLIAFAVLQFLWILFTKRKNGFLADSGNTIGKWLAAVAHFQTGATEEKPFPWRSLD